MSSDISFNVYVDHSHVKDRAKIEFSVHDDVSYIKIPPYIKDEFKDNIKQKNIDLVWGGADTGFSWKVPVEYMEIALNIAKDVLETQLGINTADETVGPLPEKNIVKDQVVGKTGNLETSMVPVLYETSMAITKDNIRKYICPYANDQELAMFLELCKLHKLNPWIKDIYLIKYNKNDQAKMVVSKDLFLKRADAQPSYRGLEAGIIVIDENKNVNIRSGSRFNKSLGETLLGGWCRAKRDGREPSYVEVSLEEYHGATPIWQTKPATMIRKVAIVQALRELFPVDFQGLYDPAEMDG